MITKVMFEHDNYQYIWITSYSNHIFKIIELNDYNNKIQELIFEYNKKYIITINNLVYKSKNLEEPINFSFNIDDNNILYYAFKKFLGNDKIISIRDNYINQKLIRIEYKNNKIVFNLINCYLGDEYANTSVQIGNDLNSITYKLKKLFEEVYNLFETYNKNHTYKK